MVHHSPSLCLLQASDRGGELEPSWTALTYWGCPQFEPGTSESVIETARLQLRAASLVISRACITSPASNCSQADPREHISGQRWQHHAACLPQGRVRPAHAVAAACRLQHRRMRPAEQPEPEQSGKRKRCVPLPSKPYPARYVSWLYLHEFFMTSFAHASAQASALQVWAALQNVAVPRRHQSGSPLSCNLHLQALLLQCAPTDHTHVWGQYRRTGRFEAHGAHSPAHACVLAWACWRACAWAVPHA